MIGGAQAGVPTVLFALGHSLTADIVTAAAFIAYQQIENHVLNPVIMSRTVNVNPLLVPSGSHRPAARGQPAPDFRSATSKHPRRTAQTHREPDDEGRRRRVRGADA
jgi:hypothetical protein